MAQLHIEPEVPLAPHTTLELGGPAEHFAVIDDRAQLIEALPWAASQKLAVTVLGGGSNVVVSDDGVRGLVLKLSTRGVSFEAAGSEVSVIAQAGENWDALVTQCVAADLAGIECLSGIPGSVGAGPIQNIGAYGQELAQCVRAIEVLDRQSLQARWLEPDECAFDYRMSRWKREPEREIVLSVRLALRLHGAPSVRYPELAAALAADGGGQSTLTAVRAAVRGLRRNKSMLLDADDENRRSVGSFFLNPIVDVASAERVAARALALGVIATAHALPSYPQSDGRVKLSAAWLIESAGTHKGERHGAVGVSTRHSLALVHHGAGSRRELLALADLIRARVRSAFEIELAPEPVLIG